MTKTFTYFKALQKLTLAIAIFCVLIQCSDEELLQKTIVPTDSLDNNADTTKHLSDSTLLLTADCQECSYVVPADQGIIDGKLLGLGPGSVIGLSSAITYGTLEFHNIVGTEAQPIIIRNCGGAVNIKATSEKYAVKTIGSKHFRITGGSLTGSYGINIQGGKMGLTLDFLSTNFEVDHVEISNVGFAGIIAKTDPTCNDTTIRENFTMYDVLLHDNYIHETGGEGFYVGNSFYDGMERACGKRLPHEIKGLKIFNNIVKNAGWEAIQVGCAIEGTEIYNNTVENYGAANAKYQNNGIQISSGTGGLLYNNFIKKGTGNGMSIMGIGDNVIYNNIIIDAGSNGIFCDERFTPGEGFKFINNTIINPKKDGILLYAELVPMNTFVNNIISNPGGTYLSDTLSSTLLSTLLSDTLLSTLPPTPLDAFVHLVSSEVNIEMSNNLFVSDLDTLGFVDPSKDNYRLKRTSPAVDKGKDISAYNITHDLYQTNRLKGAAYDIGASEY